MVINLRKRPQCHYCGERNNPVKANGRFRCSQCLADNFLDKDGEIADIPVDVAAAPVQRYAIPVATTTESSESIFCSTCTKNQLMYTEAMSHFLPEPDDPEYDKFEAALPAFKQRMERQFPQCCTRCEPKVKARLQQATYNARSDHLRRVLEKSRAGRRSKLWGWRSLVVNGAGIGHYSSLFIQLLWHSLESQSSRLSETSSIQPVECLTSWPPSIQCAELLESLMILSFTIGMACIWWNPKWQHKLQGRLGRLAGLRDYYQKHLLLMITRFAAWILLKDVPALEPYRQMLHSLSLVFISLFVLYTNLFVIKVDTTPLVDWNQEPTPLLTTGQFVAPSTQSEPLASQQGNAFHFKNLQSDEKPQPQPWHPPTPPNDEDAMDWAPSTASFVPQSKKITYKSTQPSPFTGTLPALPRQGVFADRAVNRPDRAEAIGIPPGFFDKSEYLQPRKDTVDKSFAEPKFFPGNVKNDTGLESIFGHVFSLDDHAVEIHSQKSMPYNTAKSDIFNTTTSRGSRVDQGFPFYKVRSAIVIIILIGMVVLTTLNSFLSIIDLSQISIALLACMIVPASHVAAGVVNATRNVEYKSLLLLTFETLSLVTLARRYPTSQSVLTPLWTKLVVGVLCTLLIHEICYFYSYGYDEEFEPRLQDSSNLQYKATTEPVPTMQPAADYYNTQHQTPTVISDTTGSTPYKYSRSRRDSLDSVSSASSIMTTSTASGWKTPINNHRMEYNPSSTRSTRSSGFNMSTLGLEDISVGSSIAGPRRRQGRQ